MPVVSPSSDPAPQLIVVGTASVGPAPTIVALVQAGAYVKAVVVLPALTGDIALTQIRLYRAPIDVGFPWSLVDTVSPSPISTLNNLYDINPSIGRQTYYAATVATALGIESARSAPLSVAALSP